VDHIPLLLDTKLLSTILALDLNLNSILALDQAVPPEDPPMCLTQPGARMPQMTPTSSKSDKSCTGNPVGPKRI